MNNEVLIEYPRCHNTKLNNITLSRVNCKNLLRLELICTQETMYTRNVWEFNLNTKQQ